MRWLASIVDVDSSATNVPGSPAAPAAFAHNVSAPARPPIAPVVGALVTNTRFARVVSASLLGPSMPPPSSAPGPVDPKLMRPQPSTAIHIAPATRTSTMIPTMVAWAGRIPRDDVGLRFGFGLG